MKVVLLTARDPLRAADGAEVAAIAAAQAGAGHDVAVVLLEDAVVQVRDGHEGADRLREAIDAGVTVYAEQDALARRAVARVADGVKPCELGEVVDLLMTWSDRQAWL